MTASVTLYTRPGCHLCDEAREAIEAARGDLPPFELTEVDIERDDRLLARYLERIPVVTVDGEVVCELEFDPRPLVLKLDTVRR
jgi:glutaredoxin